MTKASLGLGGDGNCGAIPSASGCLSDRPRTGPAGSNACKPTPHAGLDAGLRGATQILFGGADAYGSAPGNDPITRVAP